MMKNKLIPKKADILIILILLLTAALLLLIRQNTDVKMLEIICDGETVYTEKLTPQTKKHIYTLENGMSFEISGEGALVSASDCKGQDCVKTGLLTHPGDTCACIPNKTVIRLRAEKSTGTDAITY